MAKVTKAVIAAAGFGTRFLPQTKAMPKEMLPLVDKPIIQHVVEELVEAGIEDVIIVTGYSKRSIEDHFDVMSADLEQNLRQAKKHELLEQTERIANLANFVYIRQKGPYGNATPLASAAHLLGDEPFMYVYADDFVVATPNRFSQMLEVQAEHGGSVLTCVEHDADDDYKKYGYVGGNEIAPGLIDMSTIVEKPGTRENSPSALASVSGYVLEPAILNYLQKQMEEHNEGEFQIQTSMQRMIEDGYHFYGCQIRNGQHYDTGNPASYLKAVFDFALEREDIGPELADYLRKKLQ